MTNAAARTEQIIEQPARVRKLRRLVEATADGIWPAIDLSRPYVDGTENLPRDGRFILVGNHTQTGMAEAWLTCLSVRRITGMRVRPLTERGMGSMPGPIGDVLAACGGVVGTPENATKLMQNNETVLVFPGGGRELGKFKGEEYQLKWEGRAGFARVAIANDYPIVPVGHVGGDDFFAGIAGRPVAAVQEILERLLGDFAREVRLLYSPEDQLAGEIRGRDRAGHQTRFPLMRCSAVVLVVPEGEVISEAGQISSRIAALKADAKDSDGGLVLSPASGKMQPAEAAIIL